MLLLQDQAERAEANAHAAAEDAAAERSSAELAAGAIERFEVGTPLERARFVDARKCIWRDRPVKRNRARVGFCCSEPFSVVRPYGLSQKFSSGMLPYIPLKLVLPP